MQTQSTLPICARCGVPFEQRKGRGRPWRYCSLCRPLGLSYAAQHAPAHGTMQRYADPGVCRWCGNPVSRRAVQGPKPLYCGAACRRDALRSTYRARREAARTVTPKRPCRCCGTSLTHDQTRYCSVLCYRTHAGIIVKRSPADRARRRIEAQARRARLRSAHPAERIDPVAVYERDGWRCGVCLRDVDRTLPFPDPRCATLDHIIPLSRGGLHVPSNVQCAHFRCNASKSDR